MRKLLLILPVLLILTTLTTARATYVQADSGILAFDFNTTQGVTDQTLNALNPLATDGDGTFDSDTITPAIVINRVLLFAFPIAGLILFLMILWGGFEMLSGATSKKSIDQGRQRITAAVIGFLLLFTSYWIVKVLEAMFGVKIL